ncbi:MAG: M20 family metallo-hydrolase [Bacillota bacterium]
MKKLSQLNLQDYENLLIDYLDELGTIGDGEFGLWRRPFTPEYEEGANLVAGWMEKHGLKVKKDGIGNLIGRLEGTGSNPRVFAMGSHLDTVKGGGKYDGMLGVIGGILAVDYMLKTYGQPQHTIEVIAFIGEEGSRYSGLMGSKWMAGEFNEADLNQKDENGISLREAAASCGYDLSSLLSAPRHDIEAFLELHIEQGPVLEAKGCPIGIVSTITGIKQAEFTVCGRSDHAGTTPLAMRQDALLAATKIIGAMDHLVRQSGGDTVFTVGNIEVSPGAVNIVTSKAVFTIDMRDPDPAKLNNLYNQLQQVAEKEAANAKVKVTRKDILAVEPVPCNGELRKVLAGAAGELGFEYQEMVSGAGHDALLVSHFAKVGMLFVPSIGGRSHCRDEFTPAGQCLAGMAVLAESMRRLAYK